MSSFPFPFVVFEGLYVVLNVGLIARFYFALRGSGSSRTVRVGLCLFAVLLALALPVSREMNENSTWVKSVSFVGNYWFAFMYHALLAWALLSIFRLFNRYFRWLVIAKEDRVRWRHRSCAGIAIVALVMCIAGWINMQYPVVREEKLPVPVNVAPLRIVALSDLHLGRLASSGFMSSVVDRIEPLSPDIVVFLGDIIEHNFAPSEVPAVAAVLQRLKPRLGIWGIPGNHEYAMGMGGVTVKLLKQMGIQMLVEKWVILGEKPGEKILLIGRGDFSWRQAPLQKVIAKVPEKDKDALKILLDHQPVDLEGAENAGVFLQLSGHSHNGQFFPLNFIVPFLFENAYGYYRRGQTHYWVTSGVGAWGPRIRTSGRPEIMLIDLVPMLTDLAPQPEAQ
ncbi:MAG: metallophosphoesterase [Proteobacteria bacterium]|nr:metallophosphoesterase [Pseudomonadota bacterium]